MTFHRQRSRSAKTLAAALCAALILQAPGSAAYAAAFDAAPGSETPGERLPAVPTGLAPAVELPNLSVEGIPSSDLSALAAPEVSAIAPMSPASASAAAARAAQTQANPLVAAEGSSHLASPRVQTQQAQAPAASAREVLTAGGQALERSDAGARGGILSRIFDALGFGEDKLDPDRATYPSDDHVRFYISQQGKKTISGNLSELDGALRDQPALAAQLKIVRLATAKQDERFPHEGLFGVDAVRVKESLAARGVKAKLEVERVPVDWQRRAARLAAQQSERAEDPAEPKMTVKEALQNPGKAVWRAVTFPTRILGGVGATFVGSLSAPTRQELIGAALTKTFPFVVSVGVWWKTIGPSHPVLLAAAIGLSALWEGFHGIFLNSWNTFQNNLYKRFGGAVQTNFNWAYGMLNPAIFRTMAWSVKPGDPNRVPPWKLGYWFKPGASIWSVPFWFAMGPISVFGTFIGTLAYRGLNGFYENGRLTRGKRSMIQQCRDLVMMLTGIFLGAGMAKFYVGVFLAQQAFDLGTYLLSLFVKGRPVLYVVDETVAGTKEFNDLWPVHDNSVVTPPLKQAASALFDIPLLYPITLPIKLGRWALNKARAKGKMK